MNDNITKIEDAQLKRLDSKNIYTLLDRYDLLRQKASYNDTLTKKEAQELVLLIKYMMDKGPTESIKYGSRILYDKWIKGTKLE